jgi:hypothetical protein
MSKPTPPKTLEAKIAYELGDLWSRAFNNGSRYNPVDPEPDIAEKVQAILSAVGETVDEAINTSKEIYLKKDLPSLLATDEYIKVREELRVEQRIHAAALLGKEGE